MKKWFSLVLALAMCLSTVLGDITTVFAEEEVVVAGVVDEIVPQAEDVDFADLEDNGLSEGDYDAPTDPENTYADEDAFAQMDAPSDVVDDNAGLSDEGPVNDGAVGEVSDVLPAGEDDAQENAFEPWYARVNAALTLELDELVSRTIPEGAILLVAEEVGEGFLRVVCENLSGVVDATLLDRLSDEERQAFMAEMSLLESVALYQDMIEYPLPPEPTETPSEPALDAEQQTQQEDVEENAPASEDGEGTENPNDAEDSENQASEDAEQKEDSREKEDGNQVEKTESPANGEGSEGGEGENDAEKAVDSVESDAEKDENEAEAEKVAEAAQKGEGEGQTDAGETETASNTEAPAESGGTPVAIAVNATNLELGLNETYTGLLAAVVDANGAAVAGPAIAFASTNTRVVKVDAVTGKLSAVRRGKSVIVIAAEGLPQVAVTVLVKKAPGSISVKPKKAKISTGMVLQLTPTLDSGAASGKITYTSSNPAAAVVDDNGCVIGVGGGKATIVARTYNNKRASCKVTVYSAPVTVTTDKPSYAIQQGEKDKIIISVLDAAGAKTTADLTITSSDPNIVSVDKKGKIKGVNGGTAIITITTGNGVSTSCVVEVCGKPADMVLSADTITIGVKEQYNRLFYVLVPPAGQEKCAATVKWKSANKKVAKVNSKTGVITGVKAGTTTIIATTSNKITKKVKVVVKKAPTSVTLSPKEIMLSPGGTQTLTACYNGNIENKNITYASSDPGVATVDENGMVTGVGHGSAVITAMTYNGLVDTCTVGVYDSPAQVTMTENLTVATGTNGQLQCAVVDASGNPSIATYTFTAISESGSVQVDGNGKVTGLTVGIARVRVTTNNGVSTHLDASGNPVVTECIVTILEGPNSIRMDASSVELSVGQTRALNPTMYMANGSKATIGSYDISSSSDCVAVDASGNITALAIGQADITASLANGASATCHVVVSRRYKMFAVYDYYNVPVKGSLTFPMNNATSFQNVFATSTIGGFVKYENVGLLENPSKTELLAGLASAFSDSGDNDVNLIYLCSHGYNYVDVPKSSRSTHYGLQLPGYTNYRSSSDYYITSEEIFNALVGIRGQVILVLDSCYSGQFITNMKSQLVAAGGRISVMTAATNTTACYYNIKDVNKACDFFTLYLLLGAGYDMRSHAYTGAVPADANKDGKLTFNELFNYAKKNVKTNVKKNKNKSWFHGNAKQSPNVFVGNNGDLVLFQYA